MSCLQEENSPLDLTLQAGLVADVNLRTVLKHGGPVLAVVLLHPVAVDAEGGAVDELAQRADSVGVQVHGAQGDGLRRLFQAAQSYDESLKKRTVSEMEL